MYVCGKWNRTSNEIRDLNFKIDSFERGEIVLNCHLVPSTFREQNAIWINVKNKNVVNLSFIAKM